MTILIKGMEIPENCDDCFLGDFYCEKCQHIDGYKMAGSRPFDCPLIEVPTPHGRLIDADAYIELTGWLMAFVLRDAPTVIEAEEDEEC